MPVAVDFFLRYGYVVVFLWVLTEQLGIPVPSTPLLLMAGTLTATHKLHLELVLAAALAGSLIADTVWYGFGVRYGSAVVRLVCKLSFESSACVRKTELYFTKRGAAALLLAKFIPGLGAVAAPIAGQTGMDYGKFLLFDAGGILLWSLSVTLSGRFFGDMLKRNPQALSWAGHFVGVIFVLLFLGFLGYRMLQRRAFLKSVRMSRLEPDELKQMLDDGQPVFIVDLRHPLDYLPDPRTLPGALSLTPDKLVAESERIPRDQEIVLFCTCPSEATAARMALTLRKMGIHRVRPLRGGFEEWKRLGYPLVEIPAAA
ncbi:MAG TPA: DedA family protein/thiosulfate sulfurtransferase GlpE [Acidobacteriaceae bacterium]|jgi:membrane protein DedA with SNARE-associated domain/rhodanese-related sulfurtransferase|nr:DedA family protein/thiosulfate sulfurtransferase GlpE [Acidobacteriaceae bacterium]